MIYEEVVPIRLKHSLTLVSVFVLVLGLGTATDVRVTSTTVSDTVYPGENTTVAEYNVGVRNGTVNVTDIAVSQLPFDTVISPDVRTVNASCGPADQNTAGNCPWRNETVAVNVSVPDREISDTYTGEVAFVFDKQETQAESITVTVPEVANWTLTDHAFTASVDIGSDGVLGRFDLQNTGNVRTSVDVNVSGNLSEYVVTNEIVDLYRNRSRSVPVEYRIPSDTPFGTYTGQLVLPGDGNRSDTVNLSVEFVDKRPPELEDVTLNDEIEATLSDDWTVTATDNLEVASVTAQVVRESTITAGNTTQVVNESVANVSFDPVEHTDSWKTSFTETDNRGTHYATVVVKDAAGNTVNRTERFEVVSLDAVTVLEEDVEFDGTPPDEQLTVDVFELDEEIPVTVELSSFRELDTNGSMLVGIRETGSASPDTISPGKSITVSEPETYELVVETSEGGRFRGELVYNVEKHVELATTGFAGEFIDSDCPPEDDYESGEYRYEYRYTEQDCLDGDLRFIATVPGENCLGYDHPDDCTDIKGADLGRIEAVEERAGRYWTWLWVVVIGGVLATGLSAGAALYFLKLYPGDYRVRLKDTD
ncbi:hypothetical protein [Natrinema salinisoli]|uniref:hypothetical protein n=1 Tax=Natrinema salinisoli TaxID=2878535 RepID=UPI001CF025CE|nr:hypothetical protein [Natrinema salinisoli]